MALPAEEVSAQHRFPAGADGGEARRGLPARKGLQDPRTQLSVAEDLFNYPLHTVQRLIQAPCMLSAGLSKSWSAAAPPADDARHSLHDIASVYSLRNQVIRHRNHQLRAFANHSA